MTHQKIYNIALDRPKEGFAHSPKFRPSSTVCPKCGQAVWLRVRHTTGSIIGATCESCDWRSTYPLRYSLCKAPPQTGLPL